MVSLCVASSIPASFNSPSVTFSKPCKQVNKQTKSGRGTSFKKKAMIRVQEKKRKNMHFEYLLFIPPDHNIHFQVSWCTGAGQSVSATRRWSDYSCLNSKLGGRYGLHTSTYANTHMLAHVSVHKSFRRNTNEGSA